MKKIISNKLKSKFVLSLIYYIKQHQSMIAMIQPLNIVGIGRVLFYIIQRKFQLGRVVTVIVVAPLNLFYTGPAAAFVL